MHRAPLLAFVLCSAATAQPVDIAITTPTPGQTLGGEPAIAGMATGLVDGWVSVSIDGGPFVPATGLDPWFVAWDTSTLADGAHTVTARAKECLFCPPSFDTIVVMVNNTPGLDVAIAAPLDGTFVDGTLTVAGTSLGAASVGLAADGGATSATNGTAAWDAVVAHGALSAGPHLLTAIADDGVRTVHDSVAIDVLGPDPGEQAFAYASSVDGETLTGKLWLPNGFDPDGAPVALVVQLHGGGGSANFGGGLTVGLDAYGWIGIAPNGREWGLADGDCNWAYSSAYVDSPDPDVGPGEQDILDAIDWAVANFPVDVDRIYLTGFSFGGRGTWGIGLRNPDMFAALGPRGPASDMYEIFVRRTDNCACAYGIVGDMPGVDPFVDTMYTITSGRFLVENAFNVPVFVGHGTQDPVTANNLAFADYMHGWHMTSDTSFAGMHVTPPDYESSCLEDPSVLPISLDFGHTPTLSELAGRHPDGYDWAFAFTEVGHVADPLWVLGGPYGPGAFGTPDPDDPSRLLGMFEFFANCSLAHSPDTVVFKTYTDEHTDAYWTSLDITTPWFDLPGAVRATRDADARTLDIELARAAQVRFDLPRAGLSLADGAPLDVTLARLVEPTYDPALDDATEALVPAIAFDDDLMGVDDVNVLIDGAPLDTFTWSSAGIDLAPLAIDAPVSLRVLVRIGAWTNLGGALTGLAGAPSLTATGDLSPGSMGQLDITSAAPSMPAVLFVSTTSSPVPFKGGTLQAFPFLAALDLSIDATGDVALPFTMPIGTPPATTFVLQAAIADPSATANVSLTNAMQGTTP